MLDCLCKPIQAVNGNVHIYNNNIAILLYKLTQYQVIQHV